MIARQNLLGGKVCACGGLFMVNRTRRGSVERRRCGKQKNLVTLRHEIAIIQGFHQ